jgi:hypothetical protein
MLLMNGNSYGVVGDVLGGDPVGLNAWGQTEYVREAQTSAGLPGLAPFPNDVSNIGAVVMALLDRVTAAALGGSPASVPYIFDAVMPASLKHTAGSAPSAGPININQILWLAPAAIGDTYTITNEWGVTLASVIASSQIIDKGYHQLIFNPPIRCRDFQITTLTNGVLFLYTGGSSGVPSRTT